MERNVKVINETGIHARPASLFTKKANQFESDVMLIYKGKEVNAKSIMGIMSLGIIKNSEITIKAEGSDEEKAVNALVELIESGFGE